MDENAIIIPRIDQTYENALTDPNKSIFDSRYNGFKLIVEATLSIILVASTNNQTFSVAHGLRFIPLPDGYAKRSGVAQVFPPNGKDVELWGSKLGWTGDIKFNYISADDTNIYFNFDNAKALTVDISIRYFCLEKVD